MKIIIISEQPINSICGMEEFRGKLIQDDGTEVSCLQYTKANQEIVFDEIKSQNPDLLITIDLPGFEQATLMDNVAYNLLRCKQFHLLLHDNLHNERYLAKPLNFSMFFYCAGEAYHNRLMRQYPDLPYLNKLSEWQEETTIRSREGNAQVLYAAYKEVLRESRLCS